MGCRKKVLIEKSIEKKLLSTLIITGMLLASFTGIIHFIDVAQAQQPPITSYVKGFVTDPQGLSLQEVNITFFNESESWMNSTFTDEYGSVSYTHLTLPTTERV